MIQNFQVYFYIFLFTAVFPVLPKKPHKGFDIISKMWYYI